jgi:hypothetical protein
MLSTINKHYPALSELIVVFEPTGGYEYHLREFLKINYLLLQYTLIKCVVMLKLEDGLLKLIISNSKLLCDYATCFALPVKVTYDSNS